MDAGPDGPASDIPRGRSVATAIPAAAVPVAPVAPVPVAAVVVALQGVHAQTLRSTMCAANHADELPSATRKTALPIGPLTRK